MASSRAWHSWVNAIAFVALAIIGIILLLSKIGINGKIFGMMQDIATALAYVTVAACAFTYAAGKRNKNKGMVYIIVWAVAVVLITFSYIWPLVF